MFALKEGFEWVPDALLKEASVPEDDNKPLIFIPGGPTVRARKPTDANYRKLIRPIRRAMMNLAEGLASGSIDLFEYETEFSKLIRSAHVGAATLGRWRAGDLTEDVLLDELTGKLAADADKFYLHRFIEQLKARDKRYFDPLGDLKPEAVQNRMLLYVNKARGTANKAFVSSSPHTATWDWVMLGAEHCSLCPIYEAGGPYTSQTLPAFPADGSTPCRTSCLCVLVRDDGTIGFSRVFD